MKVLHLTTNLSIGGISTYIVTLLRKLKQQGIDVYCASADGPLVTELNKVKVPHFRIFSNTKNELHPKLFLSFLQLAEIIRTHQITHVHAHTRVTQLLAFFLQKFFHFHYVSTCHSFFKKHVLRQFFPAWGDKTIAISESVREHLVNDFKLPKANICLIPNGIDCSKFRLKLTDYDKEVLKDYYHLDNANFIIGSVSKIEKSKGYQVLLEAMPLILQVFPKTKFVIVGVGKYQRKLLKVARKLGVERNVVFPGNIENITFLLEVMDLFVLPSIWAEGFGLPILEAMAMGKPIIASNTGSVYALVKEGENGLLVKPGDAKELAAAVIYLMKNPELLEQMHGKSLQIAHHEYSIDHIVENLVSFYDSLNSKE